MSFKARTVNAIYKMIGLQGLFLIHKFVHRNGIESWKNERLVCLHVPKSAGTSVNAAFGHEDLGHLTLGQLELLEPAYRDSKKHFVVIVRDPVERLLSTYRYAVKQVHKKKISTLWRVSGIRSFEDFVDHIVVNKYIDHHCFFKPAANYIESGRNLILIDFSRLEEAFQQVARSFGKEVVLAKKNASPNFGEDSELSPYVVDKIRQYYIQDWALCEALRKSDDGIIYL